MLRWPDKPVEGLPSYLPSRHGRFPRTTACRTWGIPLRTRPTRHPTLESIQSRPLPHTGKRLLGWSRRGCPRGHRRRCSGFQLPWCCRVSLRVACFALSRLVLLLNVLYQIRSAVSSRFLKDFISRSVGRESSITQFSHCRNQRLACGDSVSFHDDSRGCFEDVHCLALSCCCFHVSHYTTIIGICKAHSLVIPELSQSIYD